MNIQEIRELDLNGAKEQLEEHRRELMNLRFQHATAQLENTQRIPQVKKTIARILTVVREKEVESSNE